MGILSPKASITRYHVEGKIDTSLMDTVYSGLCKNIIKEIDNQTEEIALGWTSFDSPYKPDFEGSSFVLGTYFIFALRIDKKSIPPKIIQKHLNMAINQRLAGSGRQYISKNEKEELKNQIHESLCRRIPATPNIYELVWDYEAGNLVFFTSLKTANETLQTLFIRSFKLNLIRLFPYTLADFKSNLKPAKKDRLKTIKPFNLALKNAWYRSCLQPL